MILSDSEIINQIQLGNIGISPFDRDNLGPNSYDLTLSPNLLVYTGTILDSLGHNETKQITIPDDGLVLQPGRLYLGATNEFTITRNFVPMLEGRSSFGRLGLLVHITAGFGDAGFHGTWTLELLATHPIRVYPGQRIAQIFYHTISGTILRDYREKGGKYMGQVNPEPSKSYLDMD